MAQHVSPCQWMWTQADPTSPSFSFVPWSRLSSEARPCKNVRTESEDGRRRDQNARMRMARATREREVAALSTWHHPMIARVSFLLFCGSKKKEEEGPRRRMVTREILRGKRSDWLERSWNHNYPTQLNWQCNTWPFSNRILQNTCLLTCRFIADDFAISRWNYYCQKTSLIFFFK